MEKDFQAAEIVINSSVFMEVSVWGQKNAMLCSKLMLNRIFFALKGTALST